MKFWGIPHIAAAVLVAFLTSVAAWSVGAQRISHDLAHAAHMTAGTSGGHDHAHAGHSHDEAAEAACEKAPLSETEHNLLHAATLLQPAPLPAIQSHPPIQAGIVPQHYAPPRLAHATREPPFRPPRLLVS